MTPEPNPPEAQERPPYLARLRHRDPSTGLRSGSMERRAQDARDARATELALAGMTPGNRALVESFLHDRRRRIGLAQRKKYATILAEAERFLGGTPWRDVAPDQVGRWLDATVARVGPGTVENYATLVKGLLRWLHDDALPRPLRKALDTGPHRDDQKQRLIPQEHFLALLHEARADLTMQALLWVLWDTGFRIEEALSLNVGSLEASEEGVWVRIPPRPQARFRLKTGPRDVWVIQCRGACGAWMDAHPFPGEAAKPYFVVRANNPYGPGPWMPLGPDGARRRLHALCEAAQVPHYTPHDFRHTKAYWMKQNDWADSKMCTFLGWSLESKMPRKYGRLVAADLRATIRRDAGLNNLGQKVVASEAETKLAQLANLLDEVMRRKAPSGGAGHGVLGRSASV